MFEKLIPGRRIDRVMEQRVIDETVKIGEAFKKLDASMISPPPKPAKATDQLRGNLERLALAHSDRESVLVREIVERQLELEDVRKAHAAATTALIELQLDNLKIEEEPASA